MKIVALSGDCLNGLLHDKISGLKGLKENAARLLQDAAPLKSDFALFGCCNDFENVRMVFLARGVGGSS